MRKCFSILFMLLLPLTLYSQDSKLALGIFTGPSYSNIKSDNIFPGSYNYIIGYNLKASAKWFFQEKLFVVCQLGYIENGYIYYYQESFNTLDYQAENSYFSADDKYEHQNINNDWLIAYTFGNRISFQIATGFYGSIYLNTKSTLRTTTYFDPDEYDFFQDPALPIGYNSETESYSFKIENMSNIDWGLTGQINLGYKVNDNNRVSLESGYYYGIKDRDKSDDTSLFSFEKYNRSFYLTIGWEIYL